MSSAAGRALPPAEVDCRWWKQGYCARGKTCYFRHDQAMAGVDNRRLEDTGVKGKGKGKAKAKVNASADIVADRDGPSSSTANPADASSQICTICLETPDTFGLLLNCDHVFCLECIRNWRSSTTAPLPSNDELKATSRTCPMCRSHSDFIIPSSIFPTTPTAGDAQGGENTPKKEIVDRYLSKLKNIPCRYFEQSIKDSTPNFRPKCKFKNSCHYAHKHPITKEPYVFSVEERNRSRPRPSRRQDRARFWEEMALMERIFNDFGGEYSSDGDWGCEDEEDLAFFESGSVGSAFGLDLDFDEFEHNYGWD